MTQPLLDLPSGTNAVRVRMVDTSCTLSIRAESFINPTVPGQDYLEVTDQCFLIEHEPSGSKVMFDLGVRKDYWNLPPVVLARLSQGLAVRSLSVPNDVPELLIAGGIRLDQISAVIWSHYHWDHIGDMTFFPPTTDLVVGPGFNANDKVMPGWPENPTSPVAADSFAGRHLHEIEFESTNLTIGGFRAFDYFGDGSFYLLDTPGHCVGHICGLARTSQGPESSFIFLGGDICHFAGCFRPSASFPLPESVVSRYLCPGNYSSVPPFTGNESKGMSTGVVIRPVHQISTTPSSAYVEASAAQISVERLVAFDSSDEVLVLIAHDPSLPRYLPTMNYHKDADLNSWRKENWKTLCRWDWVNAIRQEIGSQSSSFWRNGSVWSNAQQDLAERSKGVVGKGL